MSAEKDYLITQMTKSTKFIRLSKLHTYFMLGLIYRSINTFDDMEDCERKIFQEIGSNLYGKIKKEIKQLDKFDEISIKQGLSIVRKH